MLKKILKYGLVASLICCATVGSALEVRDDSRNMINSSIVGSYGELDDKIVELADKLLSSSRLTKNKMGNIAITSFVDLHKLSNTSAFGRTLGETFFNELFIRGFEVADFRGQNALTVNTTGEFFITRDVKKINKNIENTYVLVGTYSLIENKLLINARIMDNTNGKIVASAKTYYNTNDCELLNNCVRPRTIRIISSPLR